MSIEVETRNRQGRVISKINLISGVDLTIEAPARLGALRIREIYRGFSVTKPESTGRGIEYYYDEAPSSLTFKYKNGCSTKISALPPEPKTQSK